MFKKFQNLNISLKYKIQSNPIRLLEIAFIGLYSYDRIYRLIW